MKALEDLKAEQGALLVCGDSESFLVRDRERGSPVEVNETFGATCPKGLPKQP